MLKCLSCRQGFNNVFCPMITSTLNPIDLVGRITSTMIKYILLSIFFGLVVNWLFVIIFFGKIRNAQWYIWGAIAQILSVIVILVFVVVYPFIYLWNMRIMAVTSTIKVIWNNYREQIVEFVINRICTSTYANKLQKWQHSLATRKDRFKDLPIVVRRFFNRVKWKIPLFDRFEMIMKEVDFTNVCDEAQLRHELNVKMEPYVKSNEKLQIGWWFRTLVGINMLCIVVTYFLVHL